jgi:hypothetical protein
MNKRKKNKVVLVDPNQRNSKRIKIILGLIEKIWNLYPDSRFTQLLTNLKTIDFRNFYLEDDILEKDLELALKTLQDFQSEKEEQYKLEHKKLP